MSTQAQPELVEMQGRTERSITVPVMERQVAKDERGNKTEIGVPRNVFVRPLPFRRWAKAMAHAGTILGAIPSAGFDFTNLTQIAFLATHIIGQVPDELFAVLSLATDEDMEFFDRIDLDDGVKIAQAVIEVNKDFFVQKVLPLLSEVAPALKDKVESLTSTSGQTQ